MNDKRKKIISIYKIGIIISIFSSIIIFAIFRFKLPFLLITILCFGILITSRIANRVKLELSNDYNDKIVSEALKTKIDNLTYNHKLGIDKKEVKESKVIDLKSKYISNNLFTGNYKNANFKQANIEIEELVSHFGPQDVIDTFVTVFTGLLVIYEFENKFNDSLILCQKGFKNFHLSKIFNKVKYSKVSTCDDKFNNNFIVYASSKECVSYILNYKIIEIINKIVEDDCKYLICILDNKIYIYTMGNPYKVDISKEIEDENIQEYKDYIANQCNLIDELFRIYWHEENRQKI